MSNPIKILFNEVQITGGVSESGADGVTVVSGGADDQLTSASALFQTNGTAPGETLTITGGGDAGSYIVKSVDSETQITIVGTWPVGGLTGQVYSVGSNDFLGLRPGSTAVVTGPQHGSIIYSECASSGLFQFQAGQPYGPDALDWIRIERIILYLDEANITALSLTVFPPEGDSYPIPFVRDLTDWATGGMERILHLGRCGLRLRPGSSLKLETLDAVNLQMAEVWWERERQIRQDPTTGAEVFAYGV